MKYGRRMEQQINTNDKRMIDNSSVHSTVNICENTFQLFVTEIHQVTRNSEGCHLKHHINAWNH